MRPSPGRRHEALRGSGARAALEEPKYGQPIDVTFINGRAARGMEASASSMKLDLGSGPTPRDGFVGVDLHPPDHPWGVRFRFGSGEPWPFADESVEELYSSHLIEHLDSGTANGRDILAQFFEEAWRVAKPGAPFFLRWPSIIDEETGQWLQSAFFDPTHRRWIPRDQLLYWSVQGRRDHGVEQYDFRCNWVVERIGQAPLTSDRSVLEYQALLRKHPL